MSVRKEKARLISSGRYAATLDPSSDTEVYDEEFEELVRQMLIRLGEDPEREGLRRTPLRVSKAMDFLTSGNELDALDIARKALFKEDCNELVLVRDIEFYSLCEHHLLPFFGRAHVGYLPNGKVIGLSKIARVVDVFARRLQVQERLTNQVADALMTALEPHGVAVVMEASHTCMMMRGVQKQNSSTVTSAMRGTFERDPRTRAEFMSLLRS
jgi:GTP cyclohydrolase I